MQLSLSKFQPSTDLAIVPLFAEERAATIVAKKIKLALPMPAEADFKNEPGAVQLIYATTPKRVLLLGLGSKNKFGPDVWRTALHALAHTLPALEIDHAALFLPNISSNQLHQYLELTGFSLPFSSYRFNWYRKEKTVKKNFKLNIIADNNKRNAKALEIGQLVARAANTARDLANHPGNVATPTHLAEHAKQIAKKYGINCKVLGPAEIAKEGMGLLAGVSQGSDQPPRFIIMEYGDKKKPPIVLIGKGLTFDSGGVSIKPADKMDEMKFDMSGGATVLGILEAVAALRLPLHIVGLVPSSENLISGKAVKPGDILVAHDQTSVEVINTDAEGRLVLADALSFAQKYYKPKLMIDYATLTGAVIISLGDQYTGYFANTKAYEKQLNQSAARTAEQFWPLPLASEYREQLRSLTADIKNIGEKGSAGSITAALFLEHFVHQTPWIHFDIAGTAWTMRPKSHASPGATAWGVYLTVDFLRNL